MWIILVNPVSDKVYAVPLTQTDYLLEWSGSIVFSVFLRQRIVPHLTDGSMDGRANVLTILFFWGTDVVTIYIEHGGLSLTWRLFLAAGMMLWAQVRQSGPGNVQGDLPTLQLQVQGDPSNFLLILI